jgi:hypothetical protein
MVPRAFLILSNWSCVMLTGAYYLSKLGWNLFPVLRSIDWCF